MVPSGVSHFRFARDIRNRTVGLTETMAQGADILHLQSRFHSYADFNAGIRDWGIDFRQIGRGRLTADLDQQLTSQVGLLQLRFNRPVAMTGAPPQGTSTFGMVGLDTGVTWNGRDVHPHQILHFEAGREFVSLAPAGFVGRTVSVDNRLLETVAANLGYDDFLSDLKSGGNILPACPDAAARLVTRMSLERKTPVTLLSIVEGLILMIARGHSDTTAVGRTRYSRVVDEAVSYILQNARQAPTVGEICAAVGVSQRTIHRAFSSRLGHGPKSSVLAVRLEGARRDLLRADPGIEIREIANRWGFWHMGDFAMRYAREFGELPSDGLAVRAGPARDVTHAQAPAAVSIR